MKLTCISTSNVSTAKGNSVSTKTAQIVKGLIEEQDDQNQHNVDILELIDYDLKPCSMCEECMPSNKCTKDSDFNKLTDKLKTSDGLFFVIPHYAPVPSKLIIMFEKIEEIFFLNTCQDKKFSFSLSDKSVGIIGHGGMIENYERFYQENILNPINNVLRAIRMNVIEVDGNPGVMFGAKDYHEQEKTITPGIEHNWDEIKKKVTPLVDEFMKSCS